MGWVGAGQLLVAGLLVGGCATTSGGTAPTASAEQSAGAAGDEDQASEEVREHHRHHHHGGVTAFIAMSIDSLGLPPEKKAQVEKIQADLEAKLAPARDAEHALLKTIADGVAAGSIDTAKVDANLAAISAASTGIHDATHDALNQLHAVLSPEERAALVEKVQSHWEVWRKVSHEEKSATHEKGSHLHKLAKQLDLTPEQVARIEEGLNAAPAGGKADAAAIQAHIDAFSKAFVADQFDAASLSTGNTANAHIAKAGAERIAHFYEVVTPVLTPEQRTKLAAHLEKHLNSAPARAN